MSDTGSRLYRSDELPQPSPLYIAFPDYQHLPTLLPEGRLRQLVARHIRSKLSQPERGIGLWRIGKPASAVAMPEASVNENRRACAGEHDVRPASQPFRVQTKTESGSE